MGDIADMHLDGTLCECCGDFLGDACGYPRRCTSCGGDEESDYIDWKEVKKETHKISNERRKYFEPLLKKKGAVLKNNIYFLGEWMCFPGKGYARDRNNHDKTISLKRLLKNKGNKC